MRRFTARPLLALAVAAMGVVDVLSAVLSLCSAPPPASPRPAQPAVA